MGLEGLAELAKFVREGGTLITEGSTATILPEYGITTGVTVEEPSQLFVRGSILRGKIADPKSPLTYGYAGTDLPVYFSQAPVLNAGGRGGPPAAAEVRTRPRPEHRAERRTTPAVSVRGDQSSQPAAGDDRRPRDEEVARVRPQAAARLDADRQSAARRHAVPRQSKRHAPVGHDGQRTVPRGTGDCGRRRSARVTS